MGMGCCCGGCLVEYGGYEYPLGTWSGLVNTGMTPGIALADYTYSTPSMRVRVANMFFDGPSNGNGLDDEWLGVVAAYDDVDGSYLMARVHGYYDQELQLCKFDGSSLSVLASADIVLAATNAFETYVPLLTVCYDHGNQELYAVLAPDTVSPSSQLPFILRATGVAATGKRAGVYVHNATKSSWISRPILQLPKSSCLWCGCLHCGKGGAPLSHNVTFSGITDNGGWFESNNGWECQTGCVPLNTTHIVDHQRHDCPCDYRLFVDGVSGVPNSFACPYIVRVRYAVIDGQLSRIIEIMMTDYDNVIVGSDPVCGGEEGETGTVQAINSGGYYVEAWAIDPIDACSESSVDLAFNTRPYAASIPTAKCDWSNATVSVSVTMP